MSVTLINGDGNPRVLAAQDSDWYATLTEQTTCILKVNGNLEATITDSNTIEIDSGVCISKEGRRVQIDSGDVAEIIIPTGTQGVDTYYIIGFHLYIDDEGTQVAETFCQTMESSTATITETTFKEGSSSIYLSLYRVKREGLSLVSVNRMVPLMDLPSNYIAEHEEGATASQNYSIGDYFTNAGSLKKVIAAITSGDAISDSNTSDTTVASELSRINSDLSASLYTHPTNTIWTTSYADHISKSSNIVTVYFGGVTSSSVQVVKDSTVLCQIPEGYRPLMTVPLQMRWSNSGTTTSELVFGQAWVHTDGSVTSNITTTNMKYWSIQGSWGV